MSRRDFVIQPSETLVLPVLSAWVDSADYNCTLDLPLGCYYLTLAITVDTLATGPGIITLRPFMDADRTIVGGAFHLRAYDAASSSATYVINNGSGGYMVEVNLNSVVGKRMPLPLPFGICANWNKGASTGAAALSIKLIASRDA